MVVSRGENDTMIPYRILLLVTVCLSQAALARAFQSTEGPLGMMLEVQGEVAVERENTRTPAVLADLLFAGDRVITGSGQAILIFCPSEQTITIDSGTVALLGSDTVSVVNGDPLSLDPAQSCVLPQVAVGAESLEQIAGLTVRGGSSIPLYVGGKISDVRPIFRWAAVENTETFYLTVSDLTGNTVWELQTAELSAAYPSTLPPLAEGSYLWELRGQNRNRTTAFQVALFQVEPHSILTSDPTDNPARLLRALELESFGYNAEAAQELRALLSGDSTDERILSRITWLYWNAGLIAAADETMKRLDAIR